MLRAALLGAADNRALQRFVSKHGRRFGAYRFVAGESLDECMLVVHSINQKGVRVAAGILGEDVRSRHDALAVAAEYRDVLDRFARERADANVALKLSHLGLAIDEELAYDNVATVVRSAAKSENFVRIDMEQSAYTDATLATYRRLRAAHLDNVGAVLQAYLYRSEADLRSLIPLRPNLRLVKGAYLEPASIAFRKKDDVDRNFLLLIETSLTAEGFTAIATHDTAVIEHAIEFVTRRGIPRDRFEFQMLYGIRPKLQRQIVSRGFSVRVAVPFGSHWYPYLMRRLAERPANVLFFLSSLWRG